MATCSSQEVLEDQIDAIRWTCESPVEIVVVDDKGGLDLDCHVIRSEGKIHRAAAVGFKVNEGIAWAISQGIPFDMVMVLDDDALPLGKGLDTWAQSIMSEGKIGLLGTKDAVKSCENYTRPNKASQMLTLLKSWVDVPDDWKPPQECVFYAVNFQSRSLVDKLHDVGLLTPDKETWSHITPCETFQAWVTELFGYHQEFWGRYPYDLKPPLYSMHHGTVLPPDPRTLSSEFLIHHSIRNVEGVDEWDIRSHYQQVRNPIRFI